VRHCGRTTNRAPGAVARAGDIRVSHLPPHDFGVAGSETATNYFLTTSAFSTIAMPPRSASLPFTVTFLPHKSASSSFIGLCSPTTRYALPSLTTPTGPPLLMHLAPQDCPCFSPTAL